MHLFIGKLTLSMLRWDHFEDLDLILHNDVLEITGVVISCVNTFEIKRFWYSVSIVQNHVYCNIYFFFVK